MRSLCLFSSYFTGREIPYYITIYLKELKKQFHDVVFLTSQKSLLPADLDFLKEENISVLFVENKGFDFGAWYQAFQQVDAASYDQLALVNDSCILFKSLDSFMSWSSSNAADVKGITLSEAVYPHLQSYFLLINKSALKPVLDYFEKHKIIDRVEDVIFVYEIGLSRYLQEKKLVIAAFINNYGYKGEFSPYYYCIDHHLVQGIPVIKKKIIFNSYRNSELFTLARMNFNINPAYYLEKITGLNNGIIIDLDRFRRQKSTMTFFGKIKYNALRIFIRVFRPLYKLLKRA